MATEKESRQEGSDGLQVGFYLLEDRKVLYMRPTVFFGVFYIRPYLHKPTADVYLHHPNVSPPDSGRRQACHVQQRN